MTEVGSHKWPEPRGGEDAGALKDFGGAGRAPPSVVLQGTFTLEGKGRAGSACLGPRLYVKVEDHLLHLRGGTFSAFVLSSFDSGLL